MSNEMDSPSPGLHVMSWLDEPATISRIKNLMNDFHVPGLAIAIIDGSEIRSRAFGNACLDPPTPCTPDTTSDIASCSKALTPLAVALLVENEHEFNFEREQAKGTLQVDMEAYQGSLWNIDHRTLIVREMDGCLCVDGRDRSISFKIILEYVADNTIFRGYLIEIVGDESDEEILPVRFKFDTEGKVIAVGLGLEKALGSDHLIWFIRDEGREQRDV